MNDPKEIFIQGKNLSPDDIKVLESEGISGTVRIGGFSADFISLGGETFHVNLTSAALCLGVTSLEQDYMLFVEQADRSLSDGSHPWELPSGSVDPNTDLNIYGTLIREVFEETGVVLTNALTIAVAVKCEQNGIPDITVVPTTDNEIWIHSCKEIKELAKHGDLEGGLICFSLISLENFIKRGVSGLVQASDGSMTFIPPSNVDHNEISRIVLEPLDTVMQGNSEYVLKTSHMWAQADAFRAFMLKIHSGYGKEVEFY